MRKNSFIVALVIIFMLTLPAIADLRPVHRASQVGGSGLMYMRIGEQLDPKEMNASIFVEYMSFYSKMPLNPTRVGDYPFVDDPRGDGEIWTTVTFNYGVSHIIELGLQIPAVFSSDLREDGVGRIGLDARFLLLNVDRMGAGISFTGWINAPSLQEDITSDEVNGGGELNFTLKGKAFTNYIGSKWLDKHIIGNMALHAAMGWGYEDYLKFDRVEPLPPIPTPYNVRDPNSPSLVSAEVIYASGAVEFEIYDRTYIGTEILWRQYPDYQNDNNLHVVLPEISYTYKDKFTLQAAYGVNILEYKEDGQPEMFGKIGFTWHFSELYRPPAIRRATPSRPHDIFEIFVPSRKPIPTQTEEEEEILLEEEGVEEEP